MSRFARQADRLQPAVVAVLRQVGARVQHLHTVGGGCPDLLVGFRGRFYLLEVKDGAAKDKRLRELNALEAQWHRGWVGYPVHVVRTPEEALAAIGVDIEAAKVDPLLEARAE